MWFKKYTQKIVLVAALLCVFFISLPVQAENLGMCRDVRDKKCYLDFIKNNNETTTERKYWIPLQVPIPFPACDGVENFLCVQGNIVGLRSIADLVLSLFQFGVTAIAVFMVLSLVIGGAVYLTAGGSADYVSKAKGIMTKSFWGLLVALLSFTILYQVDPMLTSPNLSKLETVEGVPCCKIANSEKDFYFATYNPSTEKYQCKEGDESVIAAECIALKEDVGGEQSAEADIETVKDFITMRGSSSVKIVATDSTSISSAVWGDIQAVALVMKSKGYGGVIITDGARSVQTQNRYVEQGLPACVIKNGRKESCPHTSGIAVDLWGMKDGKQCGYKDPPSADQLSCYGKTESESTENIKKCLKDPCQRAILDTMLSRGYCVLLGSKNPAMREFWHYEKPRLSISACVYTIPEKYLK